MTQFQLKISSSSGLFYEGTCESLVVPTSDGEYGVLANHVSMVIGIAIGILRYKLDVLCSCWTGVCPCRGEYSHHGCRQCGKTGRCRRKTCAGSKRTCRGTHCFADKPKRVLSWSNGNGKSYDTFEDQRKEIHVIYLMK